MIAAKEKQKNRFGFHRTAYAEMRNDGWFHVTYADEPDLTYIMEPADFRKKFEIKGEKE